MHGRWMLAIMVACHRSTAGLVFPSPEHELVSRQYSTAVTSDTVLRYIFYGLAHKITDYTDDSNNNHHVIFVIINVSHVVASFSCFTISITADDKGKRECVSNFESVSRLFYLVSTHLQNNHHKDCVDRQTTTRTRFF